MSGLGHEYRDNEQHLSQVPALHLLQNLGYTLLAQDQVLRERRGRLSNVLLEDMLAAQLAKLNKIKTSGGREVPFSEANIATAIERLKTAGVSGLLRSNEEATNYLLLGTSLDQTIDGETRGRQLRFIDWENPANNVFHVLAEFEVARRRSSDARRPDLVLFVNGIPFCVIECKTDEAGVEQGISQTIRNQGEDEIPHLFRTVQMVIATAKNDTRYATVGTAAKFWSHWREREDGDTVVPFVKRPLSSTERHRTFAGGFAEAETPYIAMTGEDGREVTAQDRVLYALCRPERLLDLARRFTLFDAGEKKIARYQQFFAVRKLLTRVKQRDADGVRAGGVIWHTQGSGKSLTMVMMAQALTLDPEIANPRVVLVTDRIDLDKQLKATFAACGLNPERAETGKHLIELIGVKKAGIITTLLHKFDSALKGRDFADPSSDVFLLIDESHRSQYGRMHTRLRKIFPNACYLGFTGTPLMKAEKSTYDKFGGVIDAYTIKEAVEDGAVVRLHYEGRLVDQVVNHEGIDTWFERVCAGLNDSERRDLKKKFARAQELLQTERTIACIAFDVNEHFTRHIRPQGLKGMLVAPTKRAAVQFKKALDDYGDITTAVVISPPDDREGSDEVDGEIADNVLAFWKQMMARHGDAEKFEENTITGFTKREEPELLIVVDKLLTGFDAPRAGVLYIAKSMQDHGLLQAIARVNRVYEDKEFGLIVDYRGLLGALDKALTDYSALGGYDEADVQYAVMPVAKEVAELPPSHDDVLAVFKEVKNKVDVEALERHLADEDRRMDFYEKLSAFQRKLKVAMSVSDFVNDPANEKRIGVYEQDLRRLRKLRESVRKRYQDAIDFSEYGGKIRKLLDTHISAHQVLSLTAPVNIFDDEAFKAAVAEQGTSASKADLIAHATKKTITERMEEDPVLFERFSKLIQKAIDDFKAQRLSELGYLAEVNKIRDAVAHGRGEDLPDNVKAEPQAGAFYRIALDALEKAVKLPTKRGPKLAGDLALHIVETVRRHRIVNWQQNADVVKAMENDIDDYMFDNLKPEIGDALTSSVMDDIIERAMNVARKLFP